MKPNTIELSLRCIAKRHHLTALKHLNVKHNYNFRTWKLGRTGAPGAASNQKKQPKAAKTAAIPGSDRSAGRRGSLPGNLAGFDLPFHSSLSVFD